MMLRIVPAVILALVVGIPSLAQPAPTEGGPERERRDPLAAVQEVLDLTAAQVESVRGLIESGREEKQGLVTELREKRQALKSLLEQADVDSTAVGNAFLAAHAVQKRIKEAHDGFTIGFENLLTSDQKAELEAIRSGQNFRALSRIGLIGKGKPGFGPRPNRGRRR